jgi:hypothetical protein
MLSAVAEAVSRRRPRSGHTGFVLDKLPLAEGFSEYFCFPCQSFQRLLHTHHPGLVQQARSGLSNSRLGPTPQEEGEKHV